MAEFCDTTPCARFLQALGNWIFGLHPPKEGFILILTPPGGQRQAVQIDYCPFCGTRIDKSDMLLLERWVLPLRQMPLFPQLEPPDTRPVQMMSEMASAGRKGTRGHR
jgi:hypothetical protein